jgi:hypothetical protein
MSTDTITPASAPPRRPVPMRTLVLAVVAAGLTVAGLVTWRLWPSPPPYPPAAVHAQVSMQVVAPAQAQTAADRLTGAGRLNVVYPVGNSPKQVLLGQLSLRTPTNAPAGGEYAFVLIDNNDHEPLPDIYAVGSHRYSSVAQGWEGWYEKIAERYPDLTALKPIPEPDGSGWRDPGMAVGFKARARGPVTFTAVLGADALPVTDPARRFTAVLALFGPDENLYWATALRV